MPEAGHDPGISTACVYRLRGISAAPAAPVPTGSGRAAATQGDVCGVSGHSIRMRLETEDHAT